MFSFGKPCFVFIKGVAVKWVLPLTRINRLTKLEVHHI
jgi:hypothetical protein